MSALEFDPGFKALFDQPEMLEAFAKVNSGVPLTQMRDPETNAWVSKKLQKRNGRKCGDCNLCCTLIAVEAVEKPAFTPCQHECAAGCAIYATRPMQCRGFLCMWAMGAGPDHLKPTHTHCVLDFEGDPGIFRVHVDPAYPDAWRKGIVADMIVRLNHARADVIVYVGTEYFGIGAPDRPRRTVVNEKGVAWVVLEPTVLAR
jgi:hypothetical protein